MIAHLKGLCALNKGYVQRLSVFPKRFVFTAKSVYAKWTEKVPEVKYPQKFSLDLDKEGPKCKLLTTSFYSRKKINFFLLNFEHSQEQSIFFTYLVSVSKDFLETQEIFFNFKTPTRYTSCFHKIPPLFSIHALHLL